MRLNAQATRLLVGVFVRLLVACKSDNQRQREINACIAANTDERRAYTNALGVALCLRTNYDWSFEDAQHIQTLVDQGEREIRRYQDSVRRSQRRRAS